MNCNYVCAFPSEVQHLIHFIHNMATLDKHNIISYTVEFMI